MLTLDLLDLKSVILSNTYLPKAWSASVSKQLVFAQRS